MLQNCKTASFDLQTSIEEIVYALMKVLSLTQSKFFIGDYICNMSLRQNTYR